MNHPNEILNATLSYAKKGLFAFPIWGVKNSFCACGNVECKNPAKHPIGSLVPNGLKNATTDPQIIKKWWELYPEANIGIVTGTISNLFAVDIDPRHGGDETWLELERIHGKCPLTIESLTGGGGFHKLFCMPPFPIKGGVGVLGPGIDTRADGNYIVVPPSRHISGKKYEWEVSHHPDDIPLSPIPQWLLDKILQRNIVPEKSTLKSEGKILAGGRNNYLASLAGSMRRRGFSQEAVYAALSIENKNRCEPALSEKEIQNIAASIAKYSSDQNSIYKESTQSLVFTTLKDLLAEPEVLTDYLVEKLLAEGGLSLFVAKPKTGKSTLARQLALAVAQGEEFLGRKTVKGLVCYLALEERRGDVRSHFQKMGASSEENLKIFAGIAPSDALVQLRQFSETEKPKLIIVDTLARLVRIKDLNDYSQVTSGLEPLLAIAHETGAHVLLIHHGKKGDSKGIDSALGSTALSGSVDTIVYLNRTESYRIISSIQRDGNDIPETVLNFDQDTRITSLGGPREQAEIDELKRKILLFLSEQKESVQEKIIHEKVEGNNARRKKALRKLLDEKKVTRSGEGKKNAPYLYETFKNTGIPVPDISPVPEYQKEKSDLTTQNIDLYSGTEKLRESQPIESTVQHDQNQESLSKELLDDF